jgi:hypothetical protein
MRKMNFKSKKNLTKRKTTKVTNSKQRDMLMGEDQTSIPSCLSSFFSEMEFLLALKASCKPIVPPKEKIAEVESESDSVPSCDNFEQPKMLDVFDSVLSEEEFLQAFPAQKNSTLIPLKKKKSESIPPPQK